MMQKKIIPTVFVAGITLPPCPEKETNPIAVRGGFICCVHGMPAHHALQWLAFTFEQRKDGYIHT
jgi:hypothetical protein